MSIIRTISILILMLIPYYYTVAHDLGIQQVFLNEQRDGSFILLTEGPDYLIQNLAAPILPGKCKFAERQEGLFTRGIARYQFECLDAPLTMEDEIILLWDIEGAMVFIHWADGTKANRLFSRTERGILIDMAMLKAGSGSFYQTSKRYSTLGIEHILLGIDHLLFVLGLLLLVKDGWTLVKTITSFTIAHSITLAFASFGLVQAPTEVIDALVALSIVFIAVEIIYSNQGRAGISTRFPWVVAFAFGLLHGFGFAGALNALGLPKQEIPLALFTFNVGVEIGQLMFVLAFITLLWAFKQLEIKKNRWTQSIPAYSIGAIASFWLIQRIIILLT